MGRQTTVGLSKFAMFSVHKRNLQRHRAVLPLGRLSCINKIALENFFLKFKCVLEKKQKYENVFLHLFFPLSYFVATRNDGSKILPSAKTSRTSSLIIFYIKIFRVASPLPRKKLSRACRACSSISDTGRRPSSTILQMPLSFNLLNF